MELADELREWAQVEMMKTDKYKKNVDDLNEFHKQLREVYNNWLIRKRLGLFGPFFIEIFFVTCELNSN